MNSRVLADRIMLYRSDGWTVNLDKMELTKTHGNTSSSRGIPPDGEYDTWYPLPITADVPELSSHDSMVQRALDINKRIAIGERLPSLPGDIPSAWLDYDGYYRNDRMYKQALAQCKKELANGKQLYIRQGRCFSKI